MPNPVGHLLIVDDEEDIQEILSEMLSKSAAIIRTASNGHEALSIIKSGAVDAVLSDINMPDMNGLELLFQIRNLHMDVPFVFLTGYADKVKSVEALRLGATDFLEKPFEQETVIEVMRKALELGIAIKDVAAETETLYMSQNIPPDQRLRLKRAKQAVMMMSRITKIYGKAS